MKGYITRPQEIHRAYSGKEAFSDFHTFQYIGSYGQFIFKEAATKYLRRPGSI
jgi:hypothetical protein